VLEVCTQFPAPPIGNEHAELAQLTVWGASFGLLTLVKVKMGVTVKLEEKVPPSEVVVVKLIVPVSLWVASETAT
jgi:hypothetical protein